MSGSGLVPALNTTALFRTPNSNNGADIPCRSLPLCQGYNSQELPRRIEIERAGQGGGTERDCPYAWGFCEPTVHLSIYKSHLIMMVTDGQMEGQTMNMIDNRWIGMIELTGDRHR